LGKNDKTRKNRKEGKERRKEKNTRSQPFTVVVDLFLTSPNPATCLQPKTIKTTTIKRMEGGREGGREGGVCGRHGCIFFKAEEGGRERGV